MALSYGFFDAVNLDRTYTAEDFTSYLSSLICNGILDTYGQNFAVTVKEGLSVQIGSGKAWINGHYLINDSPYTLGLSQYVDESMPRYITVGIYCDVSRSNRKCGIDTRIGTPAIAPGIPVFSNSEDRTYLTLAVIRLSAGATEIQPFHINDCRDDETKCGYVKCILGKCKVSEMLAEMIQIRQDLSGFKDGTLSDAVKELQHYLFNTTSKVTFQKDDDGNLFYLDSTGNRVTGDTKIDGMPYQFALNGVLKTGFRTVFGKRYFYDPETGNLQLGWVTWNDRQYYITLLEGKLVNQHRTIDGVRYWFDGYGVATASKSVNYPDVDGDGKITTEDASEVLSFYTESSAGNYTNNEDGWEQYLNDKTDDTGGAE